MDSESYTANGEGYLLTKDLSQWFMHQYLPDESCASDPTASPLRQPDLRGVAPATIVTAGFDPLRDDGRAYAKALEAAGIPVVLREWGDQIHGFASMLGLLEVRPKRWTSVRRYCAKLSPPLRQIKRQILEPCPRILSVFGLKRRKRGGIQRTNAHPLFSGGARTDPTQYLYSARCNWRAVLQTNKKNLAVDVFTQWHGIGNL